MRHPHKQLVLYSNYLFIAEDLSNFFKAEKHDFSVGASAGAGENASFVQ
jgi:hypothetical protein